MKRFIVNSKVPQIQLNRLTCTIGKTNVFEESEIKDVQLKTCYCCAPEENATVEKALIEFEAPSKEILEAALKKIGFPFDSMVEVKKVDIPQS
jgi:hypothetical protein